MRPSWRRQPGARLALLAVLLWVPTAALGLWWVIARPAPPASTSGRTVLSLNAEEHATMQATMRRNVEGLDGVLRAWSVGDREGLAAAARSVSQRHPSAETPSLRAVLPPEWTALGEVVHTELDALADDAVTGLPDAEIPGRLARVTAACVACHQAFAYRLVAR